MIYGIAFGIFECACQAGAGNLYLSMGQCVCDNAEYADVGEFMERLDKLMYANKLQNKLERAKQFAS